MCAAKSGRGLEFHASWRYDRHTMRWDLLELLLCSAREDGDWHLEHVQIVEPGVIQEGCHRILHAALLEHV